MTKAKEKALDILQHKDGMMQPGSSATAYAVLDLASAVRELTRAASGLFNHYLLPSSRLPLEDSNEDKD